MCNYTHPKKNNNDLKTNIMIVGKFSAIKGFFLFLMAVITLLVAIKLFVAGGVFNSILAVANIVFNATSIVILYKQWQYYK